MKGKALFSFRLRGYIYRFKILQFLMTISRYYRGMKIDLATSTGQSQAFGLGLPLLNLGLITKHGIRCPIIAILSNYCN